jgi:DNA polymerase III subunit delta'
MALPQVVGHEHVFETFRRALEHGRLASTFLFVGPPGIGKWTTALSLAQALLCETTPSDQLEACQTCPGCQQVAAQTHPDLLLVRKPDDKNFIPIESFIGDRDHRMREGLCHEIALKPFRGGRRIAIIDDADYLNQEGANCLLKTLEEPPHNSLIMLIGTSQQRQIPTIRSRCQIIRFGPLTDAQVAALLADRNMIEDHSRIATLATRADGSLRRALELSDPELDAARVPLLEHLSQPDVDSVTLATHLQQFVEAAGKDAPPRRARLRQVVLEAAEFYRSVMRQLSGVATRGDEVTDQFVHRAIGHWTGKATTASRCLDVCLVALNQIEANANVATLTASWVDELAQLTLQQG